MTNKDLIFLSLVGSKKAKTYNDMELVQNEIIKHVYPPVNFLPFKGDNDNVKATKSTPATNIWQADKPLGKDKQFVSLSFSLDDGQTWFLLPYEPLVSVSGKNKIIRRSVAKWNSDFSKNLSGTIKERWSQDDYEITITGVLIGSLMKGKFEECFPIEDFEKLHEVMTTSKEIRVACNLLEKLGINKIVIEDFSFPFTSGENVQAYEIKAYSDFSYNLLLEI